MANKVLQYLNKIKISVNENDQMLWETQAASKSYNEATEKLIDECDQLKNETTQIDEEISKTESQIQILESNFKLQVESLPLNQQSLINQRLYKKHLAEKNERYQKETDKIIDEYARFIESCGEKLKSTNPTYKIIQAKRTELRLSKIQCMELERRIIELKETKKQRAEIKRKLFYNAIVDFARSRMDRRRYLEATAQLREAAMREREYMVKLTEVTETLKRKQTENFLRNQAKNLDIPHIEFSVNDAGDDRDSMEVKTQLNNPIADLPSIPVEKNTNKPNGSGTDDNRKLKFNSDNSKVRILEDKILKLTREADGPRDLTTKEERRNEIEAKIRKVVQNFNKSISRHSSRKSIVSSQKSLKVDRKENKEPDEKPTRQSNVCREEEDIEKSQKSQKDPCETSGATQEIQNLNLTGQRAEKTEAQFKYQFPDKQISFFDNEAGIFKTDPVQTHSSEAFGNNKFSRKSQGFSSANPTASRVEKITSNVNKSSQFCDDLGTKVQGDVTGEKSTFAMPTSGFTSAFGTIGNASQATFLDTSGVDNNLTQCSNIEMPGFLMNISGDFEYDYKGLGFDPNRSTTEENDPTAGTNLFSFGQSNNFFSFK